MSGFGIHEQYAAGLEMWSEGKRWREEAFMQQLALNGSLLLLANHDSLWRECLARVLGQPESASWEAMCQLLRSMPAYQARRKLYVASSLWHVQAQRLRLRLLARALGTGAYVEFTEEGEMRGLTRGLELRAKQLDDLSWCLSDKDEGPIAVIKSVTRSKAPGKVRGSRKQSRS